MTETQIITSPTTIRMTSRRFSVILAALAAVASVDGSTLAHAQNRPALSGTVAAATIRGARTLTDTAELKRIVGPYLNFRDTAVLNAATSVADDRTASVPARQFAIRTLWILRTGKFWMGYDQMLPTSEATAAIPVARCGQGVHVSDVKPYWVEGATPPPGFESQILALAERLRADSSQPLGVRAAATCALLD